MGIDFITLSIPIFFILMGIELWVAHVRKIQAYRFSDSITDLSCGISSQVVGVFIDIGLLAAYAFFYHNYKLFTFSSSALEWIFAFVFIDFAYYWWHRASHRSNILWAVHVVHHQSQDYNLAVALRQAWFSGLTSWIFYLPLAFFGVNPLVFVGAKALSTLFQFWIHTELVGKLGVLEYIINTPSAHRVHHAVNPKYLDKNYAATFMIWDILFGTYQKENEPCVYGTVKPFTSWNSIWANFDYIKRTYELSKSCNNIYDKIRAWWMPPDWLPDYLGPAPKVPEVHPSSFTKWDTPINKATRNYVAFNFVLVVVATSALLFLKQTATLPILALGATLILWTLLNWGALLENKAWARSSEVARWIGVVASLLFIAFG